MLYYMLQIFSSFVAVQVNDVIRNETSMVVSSPDGARTPPSYDLLPSGNCSEALRKGCNSSEALTKLVKSLEG